jgi:hypothetical protein
MVNEPELVDRPQRRVLSPCVRCGTTHPVVTRKLTRPMDPADCPVTWTHWAQCPVTGEPVMLAYAKDLGLPNPWKKSKE